MNGCDLWGGQYHHGTMDHHPTAVGRWETVTPARTRTVPERNKQPEPKVNPASVNNSSANDITTWAFRCADILQPPTGRLAFLFGPVWKVNVDSVELDRRAIDPVTSSCTRPTVHRDATHICPVTLSPELPWPPAIISPWSSSTFIKSPSHLISLATMSDHSPIARTLPPCLPPHHPISVRHLMSSLELPRLSPALFNFPQRLRNPNMMLLVRCRI